MRLRFLSLGSLLTVGGLLGSTACATLIGLDEYEVDGTATGGKGAAGDGSGGNGSGGEATGGNASGGTASGGAAGSDGTGGGNATGGSVGCDAAECDDNNPCTDPVCVEGECGASGRGLGAECPAGVCTDDVTPSCVRCLDTASGDAVDLGCSDAAPRCITVEGVDTCAGCVTADDCAEPDPCSTVACTGEGVCAYTPRAAGTPCSGGVCDGTQSPQCLPCLDTAAGSAQDAGCSAGAPICNTSGTPTCVACLDTASGTATDLGCSAATPVCNTSGTPTCVECTQASHCSDGVSCTVDTCSAGVCAAPTLNDAACSGTAAACVPNECATASGCRSETILVNETSMYRNGSFELNDLPEPGPWAYIGDYDLVYACGTAPGTGCSGRNGTTYAAHGTRALWLGGVSNNQDAAYQILTLPAGVRTLRIVAHTNFQTQSTSASNDDFVEVWLRNLAGNPLVGAPVWRRTAQNAALSGVTWTNDGLSAEVNVAALAGTDVRISVESTTNASQRTDFFFDHFRITAVVCQ